MSEFRAAVRPALAHVMSRLPGTSNCHIDTSSDRSFIRTRTSGRKVRCCEQLGVNGSAKLHVQNCSVELLAGHRLTDALFVIRGISGKDAANVTVMPRVMELIT